MREVVLAAGFGTRLGPDFQLPKGLISYGDTNLITHTVNGLYEFDSNQVAVVTNARYFKQYDEWNQKLERQTILINDGVTEPANRKGALGDLLLTIEQMHWENQNIMVTPSDAYFEFSLKDFYDFVNLHPDEFSTVVRKMDPEFIRNRLACAELSEDKRIIKCVEKPAEPLWPFAVLPFYYYPAKIHQMIYKYAKEGNSMDAPGSILPWLLKNNVIVNAFKVTQMTIDVGTPKELEQLKEL